MDLYEINHHRIVKNVYDDFLNHLILLLFYQLHTNEQNIDQKSPEKQSDKQFQSKEEEKKSI